MFEASKEINNIYKDEFRKKFNIIVEDIKLMLLSRYDEELIDIVLDPKSKTNPNLYREEFASRLDSFMFIEEEHSNISINVPDMENFDFSGRLRVIETILNGLSGIYVEVGEDEYTQIFNKKPLNRDPIDEFVPSQDRVYIVRYDSRIRRAEKDLNTQFIRYPFSNTAPIDIFYDADKYVVYNLDKWISEVNEKVQEKFTDKLKKELKDDI